MKRIIAIIIVLYLLASLVFSIAHANAKNPWDFRTHRNGLLCIEWAQHSETEHELVIYSPFTNYADVFLFGVCWGETENGTEWYTYSDGLDCFGEW